MSCLLPLVFQEGVDPPWIGRQLAAGEVERLVAGGGEEGAVVGDDQARLTVAAEEVLEQDLSPQIEEVGRLVEEEQVGVVEEQGRELHPRLPAARERGDGAGERGPLDLKLPGYLAALPVGLVAVPSQEVERGFTGQERVVLPQVTEPQLRVPGDHAGVEFLLAEQHPQARTIARAVAADEAHPAVVGDGGRGGIEQDLVAVPLAGILNVEQDRHATP